MKKMIRKMLPVILLAGWGNYTLAADSVWEPVGAEGFTSGYAYYTSIAIDNNGIPYVGFVDQSHSQYASVMKYDGTSWVYVGNAGFSPGGVSYTDIALDSSGVPHIAFMDGTYDIWGNYKAATAMKFDGSTWNNIGRSHFSWAEVADVSIAINSTGTIYVGYKDISGESWDKKATLESSTGGDFGLVGDVGFSSGEVKYTSLAIDKNDEPYIVYRDYASEGKVSVKRYHCVLIENCSPWGCSWTKECNWETIGSSGFSTGSADYTSIAIDSNNVPYVVYQDGDNAGKATVMKYNSASEVWDVVGNAGISDASATYTSIAIDGSNTPYIIYSDGFNNEKATVKKYDGSSWVTVGSVGFSIGESKYASIAINSQGTPYVSYADIGNGWKATVMYAPSITCKRKDQITGECIPGLLASDPGPYPDVPFEGNYGQGDATQEASRIEEPGWPIDTSYPDIPCPVGTGVQGSNECTPG